MIWPAEILVSMMIWINSITGLPIPDSLPTVTYTDGYTMKRLLYGCDLNPEKYPKEFVVGEKNGLQFAIVVKRETLLYVMELIPNPNLELNFKRYCMELKKSKFNINNQGMRNFPSRF